MASLVMLKYFSILSAEIVFFILHECVGFQRVREQYEQQQECEDDEYEDEADYPYEYHV
jgi:hypothetical protein